MDALKRPVLLCRLHLKLATVFRVGLTWTHLSRCLQVESLRNPGGCTSLIRMNDAVLLLGGG